LLVLLEAKLAVDYSKKTLEVKERPYVLGF